MIVGGEQIHDVCRWFVCAWSGRSVVHMGRRSEGVGRCWGGERLSGGRCGRWVGCGTGVVDLGGELALASQSVFDAIAGLAVGVELGPLPPAFATLDQGDAGLHVETVAVFESDLALIDRLVASAAAGEDAAHKCCEGSRVTDSVVGATDAAREASSAGFQDLASGHMHGRACDGRALDASGSCAVDRVEAGLVGRLGWVWAVRKPSGSLRELHLAGLQESGVDVPSTACPLAEDLRRALESYVAGDDSQLMALPLVPAKTSFAGRVRTAMRAIPRGQVCTYGELARAVGSPGAARAVGGACRSNPLPLVVPCHRVVAATGPGGFALGLDAKRALLAIEGNNVAICARFR